MSQQWFYNSKMKKGENREIQNRKKKNKQGNLEKNRKIKMLFFDTKLQKAFVLNVKKSEHFVNMKLKNG